MKVLYFARFRQIIGRSSEEIEVPAGVNTVGQLLQHLVASDEGCASAFANLKTVKVAVDQEQASLEHAIAGAREVAFFPPVTGG